MDTYQRSWPKAPRARILAMVPGEAVGTWTVFRENFVDTHCSFEHLPEDAKAWLWRHERDQCDHEVNCQHYS